MKEDSGLAAADAASGVAGPPSKEGSAADFAQAWWDFDAIKDRFETALVKFIGDFDTIGTDSYDCSLEIYKAGPDARLSDAAQMFVQQSGFARVYVNHTDEWQTHYHWDWRDPKPMRGWRRRATESGFEISYWPEGWNNPRTADWLTSGYMTIVPDPLETLPGDDTQSVQQALSGGAEQRDCETNYKSGAQ